MPLHCIWHVTLPPPPLAPPTRRRARLPAKPKRNGPQVRLYLLDHFKGGAGIPEPGRGGADEPAWARWRGWLAALEARDSVRATTSETAHYLPIYRRYADNTAQSELAKATRAGRGVP